MGTDLREFPLPKPHEKYRCRVIATERLNNAIPLKQRKKLAGEPEETKQLAPLPATDPSAPLSATDPAVRQGYGQWPWSELRSTNTSFKTITWSPPPLVPVCLPPNPAHWTFLHTPVPTCPLLDHSVNDRSMTWPHVMVMVMVMLMKKLGGTVKPTVIEKNDSPVNVPVSPIPFPVLRLRGGCPDYSSDGGSEDDDNMSDCSSATYYHTTATGPAANINDAAMDFEGYEMEIGLPEEGGDVAAEYEVLQTDARLSEAAVTSDEHANIAKVFATAKSEEVVVEHFHFPMTVRQLHTLRPLTWLNDEAVNLYMLLLQRSTDAWVKRVADEKILNPNGPFLCPNGQFDRRSHFFSSIFISKLLEQPVSGPEYSYNNVKNWTRNFDIFSMDKIVCPVNIRNVHWTLAVIHMRHRRIHYYDSKGGRGDRYLNGLMRYLEDEHVHRKQCPLPGGWEIVFGDTSSTPQQHNEVDCGMFTIMVADYLAYGLPLSFSQENIPHFRQKVCADIMRGAVNYPMGNITTAVAADDALTAVTTAITNNMLCNPVAAVGGIAGPAGGGGGAGGGTHTAMEPSKRETPVVDLSSSDTAAEVNTFESLRHPTAQSSSVPAVAGQRLMLNLPPTCEAEEEFEIYIPHFRRKVCADIMRGAVNYPMGNITTAVAADDALTATTTAITNNMLCNPVAAVGGIAGPAGIGGGAGGGTHTAMEPSKRETPVVDLSSSDTAAEVNTFESFRQPTAQSSSVPAVAGQRLMLNLPPTCEAEEAFEEKKNKKKPRTDGVHPFASPLACPSPTHSAYYEYITPYPVGGCSSQFDNTFTSPPGGNRVALTNCFHSETSPMAPTKFDVSPSSATPDSSSVPSTAPTQRTLNSFFKPTTAKGPFHSVIIPALPVAASQGTNKRIGPGRPKKIVHNSTTSIDKLSRLPKPIDTDAPKTYIKLGDMELRYLRTFFYNCWPKGDEGIASFRTGPQVMQILNDTPGLRYPAKSTVLRLLNEEKVAYSMGKGYRQKPSIKLKVANVELESWEITEKALQDNEPPVEKTRKGGQFKLPTSTYPTIKSDVSKCKGLPGFGVHTVRAVARREYKRLHKEWGLDDEWCPSDDWCLWFLHKQMGHVRRRVTGKTRSHVLNDKQMWLWDRLLDTLAIDIFEGVPPELIFGSDEFGQHYFPQNGYTWEEVGKKHVLLDINDDKRQYTGNIVHNCVGNTVTFQCIFGGKTARSLPKSATDDQCKDWVFGYSENHWSNLKVR